MQPKHQLDNKFLEDIGLGSLPETEKRPMLLHIYQKLQGNVGLRLADQMTDQQLAEFEVFMNNKDDNGARQWLETNLPGYKDVVNQELEKLKNDIKAVAPQILEASRQTQANEAIAALRQNPAPAPQANPINNGADPTAPTQNTVAGVQSVAPSDNFAYQHQTQSGTPYPTDTGSMAAQPTTTTDSDDDDDQKSLEEARRLAQEAAMSTDETNPPA